MSLCIPQRVRSYRNDYSFPLEPELLKTKKNRYYVSIDTETMQLPLKQDDTLREMSLDNMLKASENSLSQAPKTTYGSFCSP